MEAEQHVLFLTNGDMCDGAAAGTSAGRETIEENIVESTNPKCITPLQTYTNLKSRFFKKQWNFTNDQLHVIYKLSI